MPSLYDPTFLDIITRLPVMRHVVDVDAAIWTPKLQSAGLACLHRPIFGAAPVAGLTREHLLFNNLQMDQRVTEILLWGYPTDMRGIVSRLLHHMGTLSTAQVGMDWRDFLRAMDAVPGLGISTLSKLAYFLHMTCDGKPCLILDQRVIDALPRWEETRGLQIKANQNQHALRRYPYYLECMHTIARRLNCDAAQIELFLFLLGASF